MLHEKYIYFFLLIQEDIGKKLFANGCIWDLSFRKASAKDQIIWLKRCLPWITIKKEITRITMRLRTGTSTL